MKLWITCPVCGGKMFSNKTIENGKAIYCGFECCDCFKRIITSDMSFQELVSVCADEVNNCE